MKELKTTKTIEETYGYEAVDGTFFKSEDQCREYEKTARCVIHQHAKDVLLREKYAIDLFDSGNCEDKVKVWFIKDENVLRIVNQYLTLVSCNKDSLVPAEYIGLRVAVVVNTECGYVRFLGTYNEILKDFTSQLNKLFADPAPASNT